MLFPSPSYTPTPILSSYFLSGLQLESVTRIKDLGCKLSVNLSFSPLFDIIVNRALKFSDLLYPLHEFILAS